MLERVKKNGEGYLVPATLMTWLVRSIIGGIIAIGAYMVVWAVNDAGWRSIRVERESSIIKKLDEIDRKVDRMDDRIDSFTTLQILPEAQIRLDGHDKRLDRLEQDLRRRRVSP